jgi:hypothetical protein
MKQSEKKQKKPTVAALARAAGLNPVTVYSRMQKGMSLEQALSAPLHARGKKKKVVKRQAKKKVEKIVGANKTIEIEPKMRPDDWMIFGVITLMVVAGILAIVANF